MFRFGARGFAIALVAVLSLPVNSIAQSDWEPSEEMKRVSVALATAFWRLVDDGRRDLGYQMLAPSLRAEVGEPLFTELIEDIEARSGGVQNRRTTRVTWYRQPRDDGGTDTFAAIDFQAEGPNARLLCGYSIVHFPDDQPVGITRFEQNLLDNTTAADMPEERIALFARAFRC